MDAVLRIKELTKSYKGSRVLMGVNLEIPKGAIYGLVGRNGAGKTTLIRLICGLQSPDGGSYTLFGEKRDSRPVLNVAVSAAVTVLTTIAGLALFEKKDLK